LTRVPGENVGSYAINQGTLSAGGNYTIAYTSANFSITPAGLNVVANAGQTKVYGQADPLPFTYTATGYQNGDNASVFTGTLERVSGENVGLYAIGQGTLSAGANYTITYTSANFSITPAGLNVVANAGQTKVYGTADPLPFTFTAIGYQNGDNASVFTGALIRVSGENVGFYAINQGTLSAGNNYVISYVGADFEITKAPQTITWNQDLTVGCDGNTIITLTATTDSGLPVSYSVDNTNIATVQDSLLTLLQQGYAHVTASQAGDDNHFPAENVTLPLNYRFNNLVKQKYSDMLFFDNTSGDYVAWQWYKNGNLTPGATNPYYTETGALNGTYYVLATDKTGNVVQTCPLSFTGSATIFGGITLVPNPATAGALFSVIANYDAAALVGARIVITDLMGKVVEQAVNIQPETQLKAPAVGGMYIVNLLRLNGERASANLLVK
jgi:hypothetical protein